VRLNGDGADTCADATFKRWRGVHAEIGGTRTHLATRVTRPDDNARLAMTIDWRRLPRQVRNATRRLRLAAAGKEVSEGVWRKRGGEDWVEAYWSDVHSPRRDCIIDAMRTSFGTPASVLDVGCNAGPNLRRIAAEFPGCRLVGFDINQEAIDGATRRFAASGIDAKLSVGSYYDVLPALPTSSIDVVVSSYALAYIPTANLPAVRRGTGSSRRGV
jgi:SAM-dependent methyltransferase